MSHVTTWFVNMILSWQRSLEIYFMVCLLVDMVKSCEKDAHCKPHQVCCGKRCRSWPKCFLNSDKECYYDTHCIKGAVCVFNVCKPRKLLPTSCKTDEDCDNRPYSSPHDEDKSHVKCCQGKCLDAKNCLRLLKINSTLTSPTTSRAIRGPCLKTVNCTSGLECRSIDTSTEKKNAGHPENTTELPSSTLVSYKTGIISAVVLLGVVFITLICYCCLKETKYAHKYCSSHEQGDDTMSSSNCSYQVANLSAVSPIDNIRTFTPRSNQNSQFTGFTASWILFPGLYGLNQRERSQGAQDRNCEQQEDCNSSCTRPPSYRSVCLEHELPPSYDEAVNCYCPGGVHRTGINV